MKTVCTLIVLLGLLLYMAGFVDGISAAGIQIVGLFGMNVQWDKQKQKFYKHAAPAPRNRAERRRGRNLS